MRDESHCPGCDRRKKKVDPVRKQGVGFALGFCFADGPRLLPSPNAGGATNGSKG